MSDIRWPTYFIPHGGGPCFFMDTPPGIPEDTWEPMADFLRGIDGELGQRPKAVLVISAHWFTAVPTVHTAQNPELLFDYNGFPPHTYELTYPVSGDPVLAERVAERLEAGGFPSAARETKRGLDHGVFIPFKLIYPDADVPMVQVSMVNTTDPEIHLAMGRALAPLRDEGVLIVGSGLSYHNLRSFFSNQNNEPSVAFDAWLTETVLDTAHREAKLNAWADAPGARDAHPGEDHLLPLMIAAGAASGEAASHVFSGKIVGKAVSGYRFG